MSSRAFGSSKRADRLEVHSGQSGAVEKPSSSQSPSGEVLAQDRFVAQLHLEKRRADRSEAPLSLVVMSFPPDCGLDSDDVREIVRDVSLRTRATDFVGYVGESVIAFLLPYAGSKAAEGFSKMILARTGVSHATLSHATYGEPLFDDLVQQLLTAASASDATIAAFADSATVKSRWAVATKRCIDVVGASALLLLLSPLMVLAAIAVRLSSPGPIVFRQARVGRGGVPFEFLKFRSMHAGADDRVHREYVTKLIAGQHREINEGNDREPVYKLRSDPRITAVGRFLRRTSIDELPQLFNVLRGDMSLVGPRPPIPYEMEEYQLWHRRRLQEVRPGITGLWQVHGRSKTTFDEMVRLDLFYIRNWSLWLDIKLLLKTVVVVLRRDGAD